MHLIALTKYSWLSSRWGLCCGLSTTAKYSLTFVSFGLCRGLSTTAKCSWLRLLRGRHSDVSSRVVAACCCCCCAAEDRCLAWKKTAVSATNKMCGMCTRLSAVHIECNARVEKKWAHSPPGIQRLYTLHPLLNDSLSETFRAGLRGIIHAASLALFPTLLLQG